jgi:hypothetical protein
MQTELLNVKAGGTLSYHKLPELNESQFHQDTNDNKN